MKNLIYFYWNYVLHHSIITCFNFYLMELNDMWKRIELHIDRSWLILFCGFNYYATQSEEESRQIKLLKNCKNIWFFVLGFNIDISFYKISYKNMWYSIVQVHQILLQNLAESLQDDFTVI